MKKFITMALSLMLVVVLSLGLFAGCNNNNDNNQGGNDNNNTEKNSLEKIQQKGTFIIGVTDEIEFIPMVFKDENGNYTGYDIDLANEVAKRLGVTLEIKSIDWSKMKEELDSGNIDAVWDGCSITEERSEGILFSRSYLTSNQVVLLPTTSSIGSLDGLAGKNVGIQNDAFTLDLINTQQAQLVETFGSLKEYNTEKLAIEALNNNEVAAVIVDEVVAKYYRNKEPGKYTILGDSLAKEKFGIGFRLNDVELKDKVNSIFSEMLADTTGRQISEKWFGEDLYMS